MNTKKQLTLFIAFMFLNLSLMIAQPQSHVCTMTDNTNNSAVQGINNHGLLSASGLAFFAGNEGCDRVTLDVNYIFMYKDDGTGNWDFNDPDELNFLTNVLNRCENTLKGIWGGGGSCPNTASYSGLEINSTIHQINETDAWNLNLCNAVTSGSPCGNDNDLCGNTPFDTTIDGVINSIGGQNAINVYFAIEGDVWDTYYATGLYLTSCDRPAQDIGFWTGRFPNPFDQTQLNKSQIANFYLSYLWRVDQPECILDGNGDPYDPADIMNWYEQGSGYTLAHEIGHTLGLTHHSCSQNIMNSDPGGRLTHPQLATINRSLAMKNARTSRTDCSNHLGCSYTLKEFETLRIDFDTWIDRDIIIEPFAELIVEEKLSMADGAKIIVHKEGKLTVDGGTITSCGDTWEGIKVYGGGPDYIVEVINDALIENTSKAAISMFATGGWLLGEGNAHVFLDNSEFKNCRRVLAMGASSISINNSIINKCTHNEGKWGITNWNCINVQVTNNTFNNISNECIVSSTGQFTIEDNEFHSGRADILFANVNPSFGTEIRRNQFFGMNTGIRALGASTGQHLIERNQFFSGEFDMFMDGDNNYKVEYNDITADFGVVSVDNGFHSNEVNSNIITGNFIGLMPLGTNDGYIFYDNCFTTSFADGWIENDIAPFQADPIDFGPANNCFTHQGDPIHPTFDMTGAPNGFTYLEPNDNVIDCRDAVKAHSSIIIDNDSNATNPCGEAGSGYPNIPPQYNPCRTPETEQEALIAISWLEDKIDQVNADPSLTKDQKEKIIAFYERCLNRVKGWWIQFKMEDKDYESIRTYLQNDTRNYAVLITYTTYVMENNLQAAALYLQAIQTTDEALLDFITIQEINLNWLTQGGVYQASGTELMTIETIANKTHPYAGYAKSLYYWLTDDILVSELPDFQGHGSNKREATNNIVSTTVYPNPFTDQLSVKISGTTDADVAIYDLMGKSYFSQKVDASTKVNTYDWPTGIYVVTIRNGDEILSQEKVTLIK